MGSSGIVDECGVCDGDGSHCAAVPTPEPVAPYRDCNYEIDGPAVVTTVPHVTCCSSGIVDECGVCDGDGSYCAAVPTPEPVEPYRDCNYEIDGPAVVTTVPYVSCCSSGIV